MSRTLAIVLILAAFGVGVAAGVLGILYGTGGIEPPSGDIADAAPTLSLDQPTPTPGTLNMIATEVGVANAKIDALSTEVSMLREEGIQAPPTETVEPTRTEVLTEEAITEEADTTSAEASDLPERSLLRIDPEQSEVRFKIDETFSGNRITVVGVTDDVAGDVIVNYQDPPASQLGEIAINARTFKTDNDFRNQAIHTQILETREFEFIRFAPMELTALAGSVAEGDTVEFEVTGDLSIRDVTQTETFTVTVTVDSAEQITGFASTEVLYEDYGLVINPPPTIADVGQTVILEIDFVATRVEES